MFEDGAPDAGKLVFERGHRLAAGRDRDIELIEQRGARDQHHDRLGELGIEFRHVARADREGRVIARRSGIEEFRRVKARQISGVVGDVAFRLVAQPGRDVERQQHRHRARRQRRQSAPT